MKRTMCHIVLGDREGFIASTATIDTTSLKVDIEHWGPYSTRLDALKALVKREENLAAAHTPNRAN